MSAIRDQRGWNSGQIGKPLNILEMGDRRDADDDLRSGTVVPVSFGALRIVCEGDKKGFEKGVACLRGQLAGRHTEIVSNDRIHAKSRVFALSPGVAILDLRHGFFPLHLAKIGAPGRTRTDDKRC